jgi:hypothetical protein
MVTWGFYEGRGFDLAAPFARNRAGPAPSILIVSDQPAASRGFFIGETMASQNFERCLAVTLKWGAAIQTIRTIRAAGR